MILDNTVGSKKVTLDDIMDLMKEMKNDFRRVEVGLGKSIEACFTEINEIRGLIVKYGENQEKHIEEMEKLVIENHSLKKQIEALQIKVEEIDQYGRRNTLEIHGVPETPGEEAMNVVKAVGEALISRSRVQ